MTPGERIHRNARMILEAASVRHPPRVVAQQAWAQWNVAAGWHLRCGGELRRGVMSWTLNHRRITDTAARTILRGILAPRILDEIRGRVEEMRSGELPHTQEVQRVLAIIDEYREK